MGGGVNLIWQSSVDGNYNETVLITRQLVLELMSSSFIPRLANSM